MKNRLNKICTAILAMLMIFTVIVGYTPSVAAAESTVMEDGEYEINIWAMRADNENVSSADSDLLKPSRLTIADGKIYAEITMKRGDLLSDLAIADSNGGFELVEIISENLEGETSDDKTITYRFEVEDIDSLILAQVLVQRPQPFGPATVEFRLVLEKDTMTKIGLEVPVEEEPDTEEPQLESPQPENPENETPDDEIVDEISLKDGLYTMQLKAIQEFNDSESMANQNLVKLARIEVINGKIYAIITMTNTDQMTNLSAKNAAGEFELAEILEENAETNITTYRFQIADFENPTMMQVDIPLAGITVKFRLLFDEGTLVESTEQDPIQDPVQTPGNPSEQNPGVTPGGNDITNPQTGDNSYRIMMILLSLVVTVPMVLIGLDSIKKKISA